MMIIGCSAIELERIRSGKQHALTRVGRNPMLLDEAKIDDEISAQITRITHCKFRDANTKSILEAVGHETFESYYNHLIRLDSNLELDTEITIIEFEFTDARSDFALLRKILDDGKACYKMDRLLDSNDRVIMIEQTAWTFDKYGKFKTIQRI
jgi:hypothetical protein